MRKNFETDEENTTRGRMPMNLQFFAEKGGSGTNDDDDNDNIDDDADEGTDNDNDEGKGSGGKKDQNTSGKDADKSGAKSSKTFTQEQVTRMMTKEKNQGRAAVLRELGIDPKDTKMVNMVKALIESQKSDEQKEAEKNNEAQEKVREATERALKAECKAEAMALDAKKEFVDDVVVLAMAKYNEDADFKTLIGEIKTKYPNFFGKSDEDEKPTGKKGTGSALKKDGKAKGNGEDEKSLGKRLAAQRVGNKAKSSNFMKR